VPTRFFFKSILEGPVPKEGSNLSLDKSPSRTNRYQKRRNNKRKLLFFSLLAIVFMAVLFSLIAFGNKTDKDKANEDDEQEVAMQEGLDDASEMDGDTEEGAEDEDLEDGYDLESDIDVQQDDSPDDDNVIVAYTGNWPPIGTEQEGPHSTDYSDGSADRIEIKRAVSKVTGIADDDMIEHWVGNDGEQKVVATVSSKQKEEFYQVYLSWIDNEGWQVTKVERIKDYEKR